MTSQQQIEANRVNATKSTGPRTAAGKRRSSHNAVKHGLTAAEVVIRGEDACEFEELYAELVSEFPPTSALEAELVANVAAAAWRLRRGARFEAAVFAAREAELAPTHEVGVPMSISQLGAALIRDATDGDALGKVARHEAALARKLERLLSMLCELRDTPRGAEAPSEEADATQALAA